MGLAGVEAGAGLAALLARDFQGAAQKLRAVWDHALREGVLDPGAFPVAPDLVEALVEAEAADEAGACPTAWPTSPAARTIPGRGQARCGAPPWWTSLARTRRGGRRARARGLDVPGLGLAFDHARTLLVLGRAQRRARKWGAARGHLELAAYGFEAMGSPGWAQDARAELARVGAGGPAYTGLLTPTERRVAQLAVNGLSNKEIARTLVVTVNTVEFHLRNTYAKLGVRSRVQLVDHLADGTRTHGRRRTLGSAGRFPRVIRSYGRPLRGARGAMAEFLVEVYVRHDDPRTARLALRTSGAGGRRSGP